MPVLRLFAAAREAAGTATEEVPGATVDEVLDAARLRHGNDFGRVLESSKVWCNGSPARGDQPVGPDDEVAVLPPVSGGAEPSGERAIASGASRPRTAPPRSDRRARAHAPRRPTPHRSRAEPTSTSATSGLTRNPALAAPNLRQPDQVVAEDGPKERTGRVTRLRSVPLPLTGQVAIRGRNRLVTGTRQRRTEFGRRYAVVYDTSGHKVTLGVLWFIALVGSLALGWAPLALLFGVAAGWAALEVAGRSHEAGRSADRWVAALGGGCIGASGAAGSGYLGGTILLVVLVAVVVAVVRSEAREEVVAAAGSTVLAALPFGLAAASVLLTRDLEIGAAVVLVLFVSAYEAGDFLIGSGAQNSIEGPLVGVLTVFVTGALVSILQVPPFGGAPALTFALLAAVACPLGQLACSALLPAPDAQARTARRLDSLLVLAPLWALAGGLYVASVA